MATVTLGLKVDEALRNRIRDAATRQGRAPHWLIKQAVLHYVESLERGQPLSGEMDGVNGTTSATSATAAAMQGAGATAEDADPVLPTARQRFLPPMPAVLRSGGAAHPRRN